ncbi:MAG: hypothetical protein SP1CHLAM54_10970 [Chlamydiia bacterium]|nr:hypothetical protein [Chlamydiia bacterium]MCH9616002.1 hypothetical protein [Chlamydiia bacterium]MCH9629025.1 hypothetical protein [Chlamydiia bacterium]
MLNSISCQVASFLTDPVCKAHEWYYRASVEGELHPDPDSIMALVNKTLLYLGMVGWGLLSLVTTVPGMALRVAAAWTQASAHIDIEGNGAPKTLGADRTFTLLSWNVCAVAGGYSITDGGVVPWVDRIDRVAQAIIEQDADVNCLYEIFDANAGFQLSEKLKAQGYHCYFNFGARGIGTSSGMMIASKYEIEDLTFTPFPEETLVGRTKNCTKGVLEFDLTSNGDAFSRVYSTHLQHAELPEFSTDEEVRARAAQMDIIISRVNGVRDRCIIVTGDLNLDDAEYASSNWAHRFEKAPEDDRPRRTWGGDQFCAELMEKRVSGPLNLDHTMALRGTVARLETTLLATGYDQTVYTPNALSDHEGLFTRVTLLPAH